MIRRRLKASPKSSETHFSADTLYFLLTGAYFREARPPGASLGGEQAELGARPVYAVWYYDYSGRVGTESSAS